MVSCTVIAVLLALLSRPILALKPNALAWRPVSAASPPRGAIRAGSRAASFRHAAQGVAFVVRSEPNMRIHLALAGLVTGIGLWVGLDLAEWRWLATAIALVLVVELVNTAIEQACNAVTLEYNSAVKAAKDAAAAAVLLSACFAGLIGITIFAPHVLPKSMLFPELICGAAGR
jgi:diacylglycerol kinase